MSDSAKKEPEFVDLEVWAIVNGDGEYEVADTEEKLQERWADVYNEYQVALPQRVVCVTIRVPKPMPVLVTATLPAEPTDGVSVKVA